MVNNNNNDVIVAFRCLGDQDGPRFLDGRTALKKPERTA